MKGIVFTTFFEHVEERFGADMLDDVLDAAATSTSGIFTSGGTYPFEDMVALVTATVQLSSQPLNEVLEAFGTFCFGRWVHRMPEHFDGRRTLFDVLEGIDDFHETEVKKLYPDAALPSFRVLERDDGHMLLDYRSCKPLADLAVGMIKGAARHFGEDVVVWHRQGSDAGGRPQVLIGVEWQNRQARAA